MKIKIVKVLSVINLVFLMAVVSALDTETIGADVFTSCVLLSMALGIVLMHILEHLKRKERRRRENERRERLYLRIRSKRRKEEKELEEKIRAELDSLGKPELMAVVKDYAAVHSIRLTIAVYEGC